MQRIGIYAGTFDPIHIGHLSFARAALQASHLSSVYFLPERHPRHKPFVSAYHERAATIIASIKPYAPLHLLELPDTFLTVADTLPELEAQFADTQLVLLIGADVVEHLSGWPLIETLIARCEFVVGLRTGYDPIAVRAVMQLAGVPESRFTIVETDHFHVSSTALRRAKS